MLIKEIFAPYVFEEWLINYTQGFIRRGLPGTALLYLKNHLYLDIYIALKFFSYLTFLTFALLYIFRITRIWNIISALPLITILFLPSLVMFPLFESEVLGRKEILFFFLLFLNLSFIDRAIKQNTESDETGDIIKFSSEIISGYSKNILIFFNILAIPISLCHESFIFLSLPVNFVITTSLLMQEKPPLMATLNSLALYLPTITSCFLCLFIFFGNTKTAIGICESWKEINYHTLGANLDCLNELPNVLGYLGKSAGDFAREVINSNIISENGYGIFLWTLILGSNAITLIAASRISISSLLESVETKNSPTILDNPGKTAFFVHYVTKYLLFPLLICLPLFFFAMDWGRWFFVISTNYVICFTNINLIRLEHRNNHKKLPLASNEYLIRMFTLPERSRIIQISLAVISIFAIFISRVPYYNIRFDYLYIGLFNKFLGLLEML
ncbi:MAG TPA: hypothetical protein PKA63_00065 [Oligoflexia bacterium]|nr:hypothetical protein [Oligoflexia bacterium]HMP47042.1 hypothetical protein [Oligoflexia bacterium]